MHSDVADCILHCSVCQWEKLLVSPKEELCWTDKGGALFVRWSINVAGLFPWDEDRNHYLLVTIDSFYKWVETHDMLLVHSWRATEFLYNDLVAHWGNPCYL